MTLWILFCRMTKDVDTLFTFYARDRQHAELKAAELLDWYGYERLELFRILLTHIPGVIEGMRCSTPLRTTKMLYTRD